MDELNLSRINQFLNSEEYKIYRLAGDASTRKYYRLIHQETSWVVMSWEPFDPATYPFLSVQSHFAECGVQVPQTLATYPEDGMVILEDLGDLTLERKTLENQSFATSKEFYSLAIDELIKIHGQASDKPNKQCTAFSISFDVEKFMWELNYAVENLIEGVLGFRLQGSQREEVYSVFLKICESLHAEPKRIAHRDYHSRNLMIKLDQLKVIDFQDARLGPIQYDLVSLLRDSYVDIPEDSGTELLNEYLKKAKDYLPKDFSREKFFLTYELQTIQRCFKACGSFGSFYHQRKDNRYLKYLPGTLKKVENALAQFPKFKPMQQMITDSGAMDSAYDVI